MEAVESRDGHVLVRVRVQPKSGREAIAGTPEGGLRIYLTAAPVDGAANAALCTLVAKRLGIARRAVTLLQGAKNRDKVLRVEGLDAGTVREALLG